MEDCCNSSCITTPPVNIPGAPGVNGAAGAPGAAGPNAVSAATTTAFTGFLTGDGANVGVQAFPATLAQGGTAGTDRPTSQAALGLGQNITQTNGTALAYALTAPTPATITSMTATAPAAGLYLVVAWACVEFRGTTFASSRSITLKTRNTTAGADISSAVKTTGTPTTTGYPSQDYHTPYKAVSLALNDIVALQIGIDVVQSAGTSAVTEASLALIPLALAT